MLVICVKTGITYARKVHREGDLFILSGTLERDYKGLSGDRWLRRQKKTYGEILFRLPTSEEIIGALQSKKLTITAASKKQLSNQQLRVALDYAKSKKAKELQGLEMISESLDMEIEEAPEEEEEEEVKKAPKKEAEAPPEQPVEEPEKEAEAPKEEPQEPLLRLQKGKNLQ